MTNTPSNNTVFISYRRRASQFLAIAIFQDLRANGWDVFMDVASIDEGNFTEILLNQIAARAYFLVILTPGTVEGFADEKDWMRREIEYALDMGRKIIPVTASGFSFEQAAPHLTGKLAKLVDFNALDVPPAYFDEAMNRLRSRFLKGGRKVSTTPPPTAQDSEIAEIVARTSRQRTTAITLLVELLLNQVDRCSPDVTLLVFQQIERDRHTLQHYRSLGGSQINGAIARTIADLTGREHTDERVRVPRSVSKLIRSYTRFAPC
jgi:hypothetical protein